MVSSKTAPVTAVIPYFDSGETIERAITSVLSQTQVPKQIVIVDDGSSSCARGELDGLLGHFGSRVQIVRLPRNQGPAAARNAGWSTATQPYVAFLDSDDVWQQTKVARQLEWMTSGGYSLTGHAVSLGSTRSNRLLATADEPTAVSLKQMLYRNPFVTSSVMLRTDLSHRFAPSRRFSEDYDLWLRIIAAGHAGAVSPAPLAARFKANYGDGGLTGRLWQMQLGELRNYLVLWRDQRIGLVRFTTAAAWSMFKFIRRLCVSGARKRAKQRS